MKFLVLILLVYLCYQGLKKIFAGSTPVDSGEKRGVIDEMVKDPMCETYIPRRESVKRTVEGREHFFCSEECASKFANKKEN